MTMAVEAHKETLGFQTEVNQLLHLMINALYSNKEIFLRELVSNASDACDKLRFEAISKPDLLKKDTELQITVDFDKEAGTITVKDNGIGMSREEAVDNLGTIAKSGTKEFIQTLTGDTAKDAQLIGQFGVGFYSSFIVADKVVVTTRRAGLKSDEAVRWESNGEGEYTIENIAKPTRGTEVVLHLKKEEQEFIEDWRLMGIITKYSDHISFPVLMKKVEVTGEEDKKEEKVTYEPVNRATALWTRSKSDIKDEEYQELYKHISHDFEDPMVWTHNKVEGKQEYTTLLYIPSHAPFDMLMNREHTRGLKLYVKRVFILDDVEQFLPHYLRFVKGVIDSDDLPLNISREILQTNELIDTIRGAVTKRVLNMIQKLSETDEDKFKTFWNEFGKVIKEGVVEDAGNKDQLAKLLRFSSTNTDTQAQTVSLTDYVTRMQSGQDKIYYVIGDTFNAVKSSPHLEIFRKKGIEVLLLSDKIDQWVVGHLTEFDGKKLESVAAGSLDLGELEDKETKETQKKVEEEYKDIIERVKTVLGDKVKEVRTTSRLTNSPACVVTEENEMNMQMQRLMKAAGQEVPVVQPIFELNPTHPIVDKLKHEQDDERFAEWAEILFDQAILAEGGQLNDPANFVTRLNKLFLEITK